MGFDDFPRVSILKEPKLPLEVAAAVAGRAGWLRHAVEAIDVELGLKYPPIEIVPVFWLHELRDGTSGNVPGCVMPRPWEAFNRFTVQITAPALLEYGDDLIRGLLAHEFLHVVYETLEVVRTSESSASDGTARKSSQQEYEESWAHYRRIDADWQVDAGGWLSARLQRLAALVEREDGPVSAAIARIKSTWVDNGLPVEKIDLKFEAHGIAVDTAIIERAAQLSNFAQKGGAS